MLAIWVRQVEEGTLPAAECALHVLGRRAHDQRIVSDSDLTAPAERHECVVVLLLVLVVVRKSGTRPRPCAPRLASTRLDNSFTL